MREDLKVLFNEEDIAATVAALAARINEDYKDKDLAIVGVLKGSFIFLADLIRVLTVDCTVDFLGVSSYGRRHATDGVVQITSDLTLPIRDRDVLIVEDIIDTGITARYLVENLQTRRPKSLEICTLLYRDPEDGSSCAVPIRYKGFTFKDHYVVGYGLDYAGLHRNIPFIGYKTD